MVKYCLSILVLMAVCIANISSLKLIKRDTEVAKKPDETVIDGYVVKCDKEGYTAHPTDPHKFIQCEYFNGDAKQGYDILILTCAPGTVFNGRSQACELENRETVIEGHVVVCDKEGLIAHPTDPHKFIQCEYTTTGAKTGYNFLVLNCAPGTVFKSQTETCELESISFHKDVKREIQTDKKPGETVIDGFVVKCDKEGYIAHPTDPHKFIQCEYFNSDAKQGYDIVVLACAPGTVFKTQTGACELEH